MNPSCSEIFGALRVRKRFDRTGSGGVEHEPMPAASMDYLERPKPLTLIVFLHGMGDNIMLTGVLKEYKRRHPEEEIDLLVLNSCCREVWRSNPHVARVALYPSAQPRFWNPLAFYGTDQWRVRAHLRAQHCSSVYSKIYFSTIQTLPEIIYHVSGSYGRHKLDRMARELGLPLRDYDYDLYSAPRHARDASSLRRDIGGQAPLAVVHPFSGHLLKRLGASPILGILDILRAQGYAPLVVGSEAERGSCGVLGKVRTALGLPLGTLVELLRRTDLFVGTDSAVAHLAAFANTPGVVILSPKLRPERYRPISTRAHVSLVKIRHDGTQEILTKVKEALDQVRTASAADPMGRILGRRGQRIDVQRQP